MIDVVQKLWGFCLTLRDDGFDFGDYIEQVFYLQFHKMASAKGGTKPAISPAPHSPTT